MPNSNRTSVGSFELVAINLTLSMGLVIDRVIATGSDLVVSGPPIKVDAPQPGKLRVEISQKALSSFLDKQAPAGLRNFDVNADNGKLIVNAVKKVVLDVKATAICTLRIVDGKELWVDLQSVDVMGGSLTNLVQSQLDSLNPVFDARELPLNATLTTVEIAGGQVVLHGTLAPPTG